MLVRLGAMYTKVGDINEAVDRYVGTPLIYLRENEAYTDEAGTFILYCEGDL